MRTNNVCINGRFLGQRTTGIQRYAHQTLKAMDAVLSEGGWDDLRIELVVPQHTPTPKLSAVTVREVGPLRGHAWEQWSLPRHARDRLLLSFGPTGPVLKRRQVVTMHDAAIRRFPEGYSRAFTAWYELLLPCLAKRSAFIMTVSEFSKAEVISCFGASAARMRVSGEGWQHVEQLESDESILAQHGLSRGQYILAVSSISPHKNFDVVLRAMEHLKPSNLRLVVAGGQNSAVFSACNLSHATLTSVGYVSDEQLKALYANAGVFIHPSLYEGFGIPPLEAMALGCPVIAADAGALPEVCGEGALYFSPRDECALAAAISDVFEKPAVRERLLREGQRQLQRFSWRNAARAHLEVMRELIHR